MKLVTNVVKRNFEIRATFGVNSKDIRVFKIKAESLEAARLKLPSGWVAVTNCEVVGQ